MIVSNYYWKTVTGKIEKMPGALIEIETKLSYVFSSSEVKYGKH